MRRPAAPRLAARPRWADIVEAEDEMKVQQPEAADAVTQEEGSAEAESYEEVSPPCKDTTKEKSDALTSDPAAVDAQAETLGEKDSWWIQQEKGAQAP